MNIKYGYAGVMNKQTDDIKVTRSDDPPEITYDVTLVIKGESTKVQVKADLMSLGTHWIEFRLKGQNAGVFAASTVMSVVPLAEQPQT